MDNEGRGPVSSPSMSALDQALSSLWAFYKMRAWVMDQISLGSLPALPFMRPIQSMKPGSWWTAPSQATN